MSNEDTPAGTTGGSIGASTNPLGELPPRVRVHALAKLLGSNSRDVLAKLSELGETARSAQSSVPREVAIRVAQALAPDAEPAAAGAEVQPAETPATQTQAAGGRVASTTTLPSEGATTDRAATAPSSTDQVTRATPDRPGDQAAAAVTADRPTSGSAPSAEPTQATGNTAAEAPVAAAQPGSSTEARPESDTPKATEAPTSGRPARRRVTRPTSSPFAPTGPESAEAPQPEPERPLAHVPVFAAPSPVFLPPDASPARVEEPPAPAAVQEEEPGTQEPHEKDDDTDDGAGGRRRRRRGRRGRGRGKGGDEASNEESAEQDQSDEDESDEETKPESEAEGEESEDTDEATSRRRRRRRRRKGSEDDSADTGGDDPANTVVHVREAKSESDKNTKNGDGVRSVRGSTRLEAKRQRRRDGREAGRRRAPILSEAEFLARREAVERTMVVAERGDNTQIGVLEDGVLVEHFVTSQGSGSIVGNVYLGRVQNVLPSMEAAFVDIGRGRNAVLYAGEVDWDAAGLEGKSRKIEQALSTGDNVLVQVTKDPVGHKGARLTTQISLPGRFLVYVPAGGATGISRKLPENERRRLKDILKRIVPEDAGVIIRTASEGISEEELERDVRRLKAQWEVIKEKADSATGNGKKSAAPTMLYEEPDLLVKVVRDLFTEDFAKLEVQGGTAWETINAYVQHVAPDLTDRLKRYVGNDDVFSVYRIDEQITKALDRKVWLPSGGYLVIDRTEAMTVIDVNTGKFTGSGGNLEETVTRNNLESAEEIVRQLRLRDIGGIIVIDFIDMVLESNRELVLRRLTECLGRDRTRHQVAEVTSLGLVQMTRKKVGTGLIEAFSTPCEHCKGRGVIVSTEPQRTNGSNGGNGGGGSRRSRGRGKGEDHSHGEARSDQSGPTPEQRESVVSAVQAMANAAKVAGGKTEEHEPAPSHARGKGKRGAGAAVNAESHPAEVASSRTVGSDDQPATPATECEPATDAASAAGDRSQPGSQPTGGGGSAQTSPEHPASGTEEVATSVTSPAAGPDEQATQPGNAPASDGDAHTAVGRTESESRVTQNPATSSVGKQPTPAQPAPAQAAPTQATPGQPTPAQAAPTQAARAQAAPADAAPAGDSEATSARGDAAPAAASRTASAHTQPASAASENVPSVGQTAAAVAEDPSAGQATSPSGEDTRAGSEAAPASGQAAPAGGRASSAGAAATSPGGEAAPAGGQTPSADAAATPPGSQATPEGAGTEPGTEAATEHIGQATAPRSNPIAGGPVAAEAATAGSPSSGSVKPESGSSAAGTGPKAEQAETESEDVSVPQPAVRTARRRPRRAASRPAGPPVHASEQS